MTVFEHIRKRLLAPVEATVGHMPPLDTLRETEWVPEFERLMRNRLLMGAFRYGLLSRAKGGYRVTDSIRKRLDLYEETGNLEHLVDIANLCMVEFKLPGHPQAHFAAGDDGHHAEAA